MTPDLKITWYGYRKNIDSRWLMAEIAGRRVYIAQSDGRVEVRQGRVLPGYIEYHIDVALSEMHDREHEGSYRNAIRYIDAHPEVLLDPLWDGVVP